MYKYGFVSASFAAHSSTAVTTPSKVIFALLSAYAIIDPNPFASVVFSAVISPPFLATYAIGKDSTFVVDPKGVSSLYLALITTSCPRFTWLPFPSNLFASLDVITWSLFFHVPSAYAIIVPVATSFLVSSAEATSEVAVPSKV